MARPSATAPKDVYQLITDSVISALEGGIIPWRKPWDEAYGMPRNYVSNRAYSGINAFLLNLSGRVPFFLTFRQARELGGYIRRGAKGLPVVYFQVSTRRNKQTDKEERLFLLRYYTVFNVADVEGVELALPEVSTRQHEPVAAAEALVSSWADCPPVRFNEQRAYYVPALDFVNMPRPETFASNEQYYSTLFHELIHATGHPRRLNRPDLVAAEGKVSASYAREELTAEMGAAFLCATLGLPDDRTLPNTQAYIQSWLSRLRGDKKLVIQAGGRAAKAVGYITGQPVENTEAVSDAAEVGQVVDKPAPAAAPEAAEQAPPPAPSRAEEFTRRTYLQNLRAILAHPAFTAAQREQLLAEAAEADCAALGQLKAAALDQQYRWEDAELVRQGGELAEAAELGEVEELAEPDPASDDPHELVSLAVQSFAHLRPFNTNQSAGELATVIAQHYNVGQPQVARVYAALVARPAALLPQRAR